MYIPMQIVKNKVFATKGKFFTVVFRKADGSQRKMCAQLGVRKGLTGAGLRSPDPENIVRVYDRKVKSYRSINLNKVEYFQCGENVLSI